MYQMIKDLQAINATFIISSLSKKKHPIKIKAQVTVCFNQLTKFPFPAMCAPRNMCLLFTLTLTRPLKTLQYITTQYINHQHVRNIQTFNAS